VNYYERHIGDYLKDTAHLSLLEHGVYGRLLDVYYTRESAIPVAEVERLIGARSKDERQALQYILGAFFQIDGDVLKHSRCDREIERYKDKQRKASASANARWKRDSQDTERNADAMRTHTERSADGMLSSNQTPDTIEIQEPTVLVPEPSTREPVAVPGDRPPACPTERLIEAYHRHLPMLPRVEVMNDGRRRTLAARWREVITDKDIAKSPDPRTAAIEFFDWYFDHASRSAFLTGRSKDWRADFDFLTTASKFAKVVEGHYHKETA
jgi:uncharacterized protein YdaU (DUF1376 family)